MEFKGTPGKWFACCLETMPHFVFDEIGETVICKPVHNQEMRVSMPTEEYRANALLISKAPQMISELKETIIDLNILKFQIMDAVKTNYLFEGMPELIEKWIERKKDLIKEATEL